MLSEPEVELHWPILDAAAPPPAAEVFTHGMPGLALDSGEFVPAAELNAAPLETTEDDARPVASAVVLAALANALPAHRLEAVGDPLLLAEVRSLVDQLMEAFRSKYPTQPKMGPDWWASIRAKAEALLQQIGAAA